ncbi:response regulator transcription factor [Cohnella rhizosphaerae]|uniref:Helix-turn-helix domain-containing protein n=1 Tax=Cohnella rhizosphaerae TaxID=1457232 RepID=A0A9X4L316_9BACL|nr:response regulator transcription factor [Cohnella rhizosphaerae]MDG0812724.1 helix-turn-helix domain-containing protein [Cohnella rhizosphaerae]
MSGYADFAFLQGALRQGAYDYLLKPADEDAIFGLMEGAVETIEREIDEMEMMAKAKAQLLSAQPLLLQDFVQRLLGPGIDSLADIQEQLNFLDRPMRSDNAVMLMMARIDRWPPHLTSNDRLLLEYACNNIMLEHLSPVSQRLAVKMETYMLWMIQPAEDNGVPLRDAGQTYLYVKEMLEKIQVSVRQILNLPLSIVLSRPMKNWRCLRSEYRSMSELFSQGIGLEEEIILVDVPPVDRPPELDKRPQEAVFALQTLLESGETEAFKNELIDYFRHTQKTVFVDYTYQQEVYCSLGAMFLAYINKKRLVNEVKESGLDLALLSDFKAHVNWDELLDYFVKLSDILFRQMEMKKTDQKQHIVDYVDRYMIRNLNGDLSLQQLAKQVHLSPYYLSRLYHSEKGYTLAERLIELKIAKAKQLLGNDFIKVQQVSLELGFENFSYFSKYFKKHVGMTPQEYRDHAR